MHYVLLRVLAGTYTCTYSLLCCTYDSPASEQMFLVSYTDPSNTLWRDVCLRRCHCHRLLSHSPQLPCSQ